MTAADTHVIEITDLEPDTAYRLEALSVADTGLESFTRTNKMKRTGATMGGLSRALFIVIIILSLFVVAAVVLGLVAIYRFEIVSKVFFKSCDVILTPKWVQSC